MKTVFETELNSRTEVARQAKNKNKTGEQKNKPRQSAINDRRRLAMGDCTSG